MATLLSFPTFVFTILLGFTLLYWLIVIFGALDLEFLDAALGLDSVEAAVDGAVEAIDGLADGAMEGAAESLDGVAEGAADGAADAADVDGQEGGLAGVLNALGVRGIPITIVGSFILLWAWVLSYIGTRLLGSVAASLFVGLFLAFVSLGLGVALAALSTRPFRKLFVTPPAPRRASLVGKLCTVTSGRVNGEMGRAEIDDGGSGFVAEVRCVSDNDLKRGSRALVYRYEPSSGLFFIGPVDGALTDADDLVESHESSS